MNPVARLTASALVAVWMLGTGSLGHAAEPAEAVLFDDSEITSRHRPEWFKTSFFDFSEDLAEAKASGKLGVMLFFDTEGCAYCKMFVKHTLGDARIAADLRSHFDVIGVDMFGDVEVTDFSGAVSPAGAFARSEGATVSPTLVFRGTDGELLYRAVGYYPPDRFRTLLEFVIGGHHERQDLRRYAAAASAGSGVSTGVLKTADPLFEDPPYRLERREAPAQRPLLVLFEAAACDECGQLHAEVLSQPAVRRLLKRYELVRLDWDDSRTPLVIPDGSLSTPAAWADSLRLSRTPALVFFDENGNEAFRLESLVLRQRLERALLYVLDKAYEQGMTYQEFTRMKTIERLNKANGKS